MWRKCLVWICFGINKYIYSVINLRALPQDTIKGVTFAVGGWCELVKPPT